MTEEQLDRRRYVIGFLASATWTALAFGVVVIRLEPTLALAIISVAAIAQVVVQLRFFLHIDLSQQKREDLQLILFTLLLLTIMVAGTIWILADLHRRML